MEERVRGEKGHGDWCMAMTELGLCSCLGCGGHLTAEGDCIACACNYSITEPRGLISGRYPAWIPAWGANRGRCSYALAVAAQEAAEAERERRRREAR